jgi:hypothetical protein
MSHETKEHPRVEYVREFSKLSFWFAHRRIRLGISTFEDAVNTRVDLFRMTRHNRGDRHPSRGDRIPEWDRLIARLRPIFDRHQGSPDTAALEREALDLFWPHFELPSAPAPGPTEPPPDRPYECWTFDYNAGDRISLHIYNVYRPHSPLGDMRPAFADALLRLLTDSVARRPRVHTVACGSWLNSLPAFAELFPASWRESAVPSPEVRYTMGHWGQFTDRRGGFHHRNGAAFRATGDFPWPALRCHCPVADAVAHLESLRP